MNANFTLAATLLVGGPGIAVAAEAETDAITFAEPVTLRAQGYINGGMAWSFLPKVDVVVTSLGFMNPYAGTSFDPLRIGLWNSDEKQIVSYTVRDTLSLEETDTNYVAYGRIVPVLLKGGQQYFITSDRGDFGTQVVIVFALDSSNTNLPHCAMGPELTYIGSYDFGPTGGTFDLRSGTNVALLGPTFRYELASVFEPRLSVRAVQDGVELSWPSSSANFVLESATRMDAAVWEPLTDAPDATSAGYSVTYHPADAQPRFFRLRIE
jgi:hypothetical protein